MFDLSGLDNTGQHTSTALIVFALALTLLLSLLLVFIYEKTSRQVARPDHFIQSLLLMSLVTATIMQSIGDSLALSFGIFGALAIIRFRTRISDPRDVAFVFASMAIGIACGVHSFLNGIVGTLAFCLVVVFIRLSPFGQKNNLVGNFRFDLPPHVDLFLVKPVLEQFTLDYSLKRQRIIVAETNKGNIEYEFKIKLKNDGDFVDLSKKLLEIENIKISRLSLDDENDIDAI